MNESGLTEMRSRRAAIAVLITKQLNSTWNADAEPPLTCSCGTCCQCICIDFFSGSVVVGLYGSVNLNIGGGGRSGFGSAKKAAEASWAPECVSG